MQSAGIGGLGLREGGFGTLRFRHFGTVCWGLAVKVRVGLKVWVAGWQQGLGHTDFGTDSSAIFGELLVIATSRAFARHSTSRRRTRNAAPLCERPKNQSRPLG